MASQLQYVIQTSEVLKTSEVWGMRGYPAAVGARRVTNLTTAFLTASGKIVRQILCPCGHHPEASQQYGWEFERIEDNVIITGFEAEETRFLIVMQTAEPWLRLSVPACHFQLMRCGLNLPACCSS
jgi:hypothetical protein